MTTGPTLLLVDDHDVVRIGTRAVLEDRFRIVGEADNASSAVELAVERRPELILLDVRLPDGGGEHVVRELRRAGLDTCIVAFTMSVDRQDVRRMMNAGVDGYLTKSEVQERLADRLLDALAGGRPVSNEVAAFFLDIDDDIEQGSSDLDKLTAREREIVHLIARGNTYQQTATELGISVKTVETHMNRIFKKLGVASRHQLATEFGAHLLQPDA